MKRFLVMLIFIINFNYSAHSIDLPKYYQFPENYFKGEFQETTKGFFLVASQTKKDPRFKNTVVVMLEHDKKGAIGVVINKPLGKIKMLSLLKNTNIKDAVKKSQARPFKAAKETIMMVVDPNTGQKAKFTSKNTIIEVFKKQNIANGKVIYSNSDRLDVNNILKFY